MNDTENRLRDYLHTKAGSVPDSAHGPGLELDAPGTSTRRSWAPMALAAASIGVVLILAVPFLNNLTHKDSSAAVAPVFTGALQIPYTVTIRNNPDELLDTWWAVLHDGKQTVKNPGVKGQVLDRLDDGWLGKTGDLDPKKSQVVVFGPTGKTRLLGPTGADTPVLSPDGRQFAVAIKPNGAKESRVVVVNIEDGRQVSGVKVPTAMIRLVGWNKDGIWMQLVGPLRDQLSASVWQPGSPGARKVGNVGGPLDVARGSGTVIQTTYGGKDGNCVKASTLGPQGLVVIREHCVSGEEFPQSALSSNGALMALSTGAVVDIATGKTTVLRLPSGYESSDLPVFEDSTAVILLAGTAKDQKIFRCGVANGDCVPIVTAKAKEILALVRP